MSARHRPTMLIVDDDSSSSGLLREVFQHEGYEVAVTDRGEAALRLASSRPFDVVLSDVRLPDLDGIEVLRRLRPILPDAVVVMITGFATVETAMRALQEGAFDYLQKPFTVEEVRQTVDRAMEQKRHRAPTTSTPPGGAPAGAGPMPAPREPRRPIVGKSPAMVELIKVVARVADSKSSVLIVGERGTGKNLIARAIHDGSPRAEGPYVTVDVGSLSEEVLEAELFGHEKVTYARKLTPRASLFIMADRGTLCFGHVDRLPASAQAGLLRVLEERLVRPFGSQEGVPVDVRTIAGTDEDLEVLVREGVFLEELYRRLSVVTLRVPPLRERAADVPLLAEHFLRQFAEQAGRPLGFSEPALAALTAYSWPGNVRELESVVERVVAIAPGSTVEERDLPDVILVQAHTGERGRPPAPRPTLEDTVRTYVLQILAESGGNKTAAARVLGVPRRTLYRMLERYAADRQRGRSRRPRGRTAPSG
ncbi:MAG TPA: sigma-54 dependent transcriptional regulator [Candidatus Eisenbacteria bacterium]|nr:sigma-54 dependent transcriptional regulator [Candidatus Eisenbacteria bacterium]